MCLDNFHDVEEKASTEENSSRFSLQVPFPIDWTLAHFWTLWSSFVVVCSSMTRLLFIYEVTLKKHH